METDKNHSRILEIRNQVEWNFFFLNMFFSIKKSIDQFPIHFKPD